jgi:hypothetical protein
MKPSLILIATALVAGSGHVAFARDHMELVCTAVTDAKDGGDKIPLFIHLFESRSSNGVDRDEMLSTIYQGKHFQATRVNKSGTFSKDAPIVLKLGTTIRFRGKYTIDQVGSDYVLKLNGEVNDDPPARKATFRTAAATLTCVDLSI